MRNVSRRSREQLDNRILDTLHKEEQKAFRDTFLDLHPSDQLDIFVQLDKTLRQRCYSYMKPAEFAMIFEGMNRHEQQETFQELDENDASDMFNNMFTDNVVSFLSTVDPKASDDILSKMDQEKADKIDALLAYAHETAGSIMTKEFISIATTDIISNVIERLRKEGPHAEIIYYNYVVDETERLVGVVSMRDLITAQPDQSIDTLMSTRVISVDEQMDQEDVALMIQKYDLFAVPVVSKDNHLLGIVTVDDVIDILEHEATEDFGEISATKGATDVNISAFDAAKKRSPWIVLLMVLGLLTGGVIHQFEQTLEQVLLLSVFIPLIMDSAGNIGTQSLTVSVRGLALGTIEKGNIRKMIRREFSTGLMIGLLCMIVISSIISVIFGEWLIGLVVGFSVLSTLSVSAMIGVIVPLIINKLKIDPAVASGPFITTANDIIGLIIYFSIAKSLLDII